LDFLSKITWVKDTNTKKPLLYHMLKEILRLDTTLEDFQLEFKDLQVVSRTEFDVLQSNLRDMEEECKNSLGYINLDSNYSSDTKNLVSLFLENATQRIISMKIIITRVMAEYQKFLFWFGLPLHLHKDYTPQRTAGILLSFSKEVSETRKLIYDEMVKERKREEKMKTINRSRSSPHKTCHKSHHRIVRSGVSDPGKEAVDENNGLEEFLDAVAAKNSSSGKRRRSRKLITNEFDNYNLIGTL